MTAKKVDAIRLLLDRLPDLLDGIDPRFLVDYLKGKNNLASSILQGFRVTAQTVRTPMVRQRLAKRAEGDPALLDTFVALWIDSNRGLWGRVALSSSKDVAGSLPDLVQEYGASAVRIACLLDDRQAVKKLAVKVPAGLPAEAPAEAEEIHVKSEKAAVDQSAAENRRLKSKIRELERRIRDLERSLEEHHRDSARRHSELQSAKKQSADQQHQLQQASKIADRLLRANQAAEEEKSLAKRELKKARKEIESLRSERHARKEPILQRRDPDWIPVISAMLRNESYEAVRTFCEALEELQPEDLHARLVLEHVYAKIGLHARQVDEALWIAAYLSKRGQYIRACEFACRALKADPVRQEAHEHLRRALASVNLSEESDVSAIRGLLGRLKVSSLRAYKEARKTIEQMGGMYLQIVEGRPRVFHPDKIIELSNGRQSAQISIRGIIEAVDANNIAVISFVRQALVNLRKSDSSLYRGIIEGLEVHDSSCVAAIVKGTQPVIVDGSNVAWYESREKPQIKNILELRNELRSEGYFPVYIYIDAALPYQVDQQATLQELIDAGAVVAVDTRTDADEAIVEKARLLACPVVTNDRMTDWDPEGEIPKFRFAIDRFGITIYDR